MKRFVIVVIIVLLGVVFNIQGNECWAGIQGTKHDLSASGPGTIKALSESQICVFCHTPHGALSEPPLWNHKLSTQTYTVPQVGGWPGLLSTVQQPDKGSRLCLGCHDGTVAIGALVNMPGPGSSGTVSMSGVGAGGEMLNTAYGYIGVDLSGTHPVSIAVNDTLITDKNLDCTGPGASTLQLQYPPPADPVKLKPTNNTYSGSPGRSATSPSGQVSYNEGVQCSSCHDPHNNNTDFLVAGTAAPPPGKGHPGSYPDALCNSCHQGTCP